MTGKMTLLDIVQNILSAMDSDDVNSISDTTESYQVAREVQTAYYETVAALKIPSNKSLIQLTALTDVSHPNYLAIPQEVKQIDWFKYDYRSLGNLGDYVDIRYVPPESFIYLTTNQAGASNAPPTVQVTDFSGVVLNVITNQMPTWWTTFDNLNIVTDSWDSALDTTLQSSMSACWGENFTPFTLQDSFTPVLDEDLFPLLLSEAKSACFQNIKQSPNAKEEQRAHRQLIRSQNDFWRADQRKPYDRVPDFGRRRLGINPLAGPRNPIGT